jgi:hypothetical protein
MKQRIEKKTRKIEGSEARFTNLVEMEGHVAHLDHDIAWQSCGAEPDDHRRADQIRDHRTANQQAGKRTPKQLLHLPCLAFGACRRRLLLLLLPLPSLPPSHRPRGLPPPLHRAILSRAATERHFSGGRAAWDARGNQGRGGARSRVAIMVSYLSRWFLRFR